MKNEENKWETIVKYISTQFGDGQTLDLQAILFLIGINELGQGYRKFKNKKNRFTSYCHLQIATFMDIIRR